MPDGGEGSALEQLVTLARHFQQEGKIDEAGQVCTRIVAATGSAVSPVERVARAEAFNYLASIAAHREQMGTAIDFFQQAIMLAQDAENATLFRMNLTRVLLQIGWKERARLEAERVLKIAPASLRGQANHLRGLCAREEGDAELTLKHERAASEAEPENTGSEMALAAALADTGQLGEAKAIYQKVLETVPKFKAEALHGIGLCCMRQMQCHEAIDYFDQALALDSGITMARWNRALSYLTVGNFAEGWRDHEYRFHLGSMMPGTGTPTKRFARPFWDGKSAAEGGAKRLHLHVEMGLGDAIQFSRYALVARDMGHDVRLETNPELVDLLSCSLPGVAVIPFAQDYPGVWGIEEFDCHAPLMSMPYLCGTRLDTVPYGGGFLKADPSKVAEWKKRLAGLKGLRIGICWHGRSRDALWVRELDRRRSIPFEKVADLLADTDGISFVSLQIDGDERHPNLMRVDEHIRAFADTAALIENLDAVMTVDTAVAHVAGGLGKPVYLLDRLDHCWRWHEPCGDRSPWYGNLKIYRQETVGEWQPVLDRVRDDLMRLGRGEENAKAA